MTSSRPQNEKDYLHTRLRGVRDRLLWKLEGLNDAEVRRPMTRTGTNLLGIVKHVLGGECTYLGSTFGRPASQAGIRLPWWEQGNVQETLDTGGDMYAVPGESTEYIVDLYRRACAHADQTIAELDLDDIGTTPHTGETLTLRQALVHTILETGHHAGHADIVRELIDGSVGERGESIPDEARVHKHYKRVAASADAADQPSNEAR
jgi:uncharacterized damage-inducible protein DinB